MVPDSRNIPVEFAESRWPFLVERLGLAVDSGGPGRHRGGLSREKHLRMLRDAHFMSIADRSCSPAGAWPAAAPGRPFEVMIDPAARPARPWTPWPTPSRSGPRRSSSASAPPAAAQGDPLDRPYEEVARDLRWRKVSVTGARDDYGVVVAGAPDDPILDRPASDALRAARRAARSGREPSSTAVPAMRCSPGSRPLISINLTG